MERVAPFHILKRVTKPFYVSRDNMVDKHISEGFAATSTGRPNLATGAVIPPN